MIRQSPRQASGNTVPDSKEAAPSIAGPKVLILGTAIPSNIVHEIVGRINVFQRWFGGTGHAYRMLGDKARELGANAVVESRVWLAPAFPAHVAPHGTGIAVRVKDAAKLEEISRAGGRWE
ncbi:MAG: hypothetical protein ACKVQU_27630 [Burkholderiales bacterium]